jgi:hypothetical protein
MNTTFPKTTDEIGRSGAIVASGLAALVVGAAADLILVWLSPPSPPAHHAAFVAGELTFLGLGKSLEMQFVWAMLSVTALGFTTLELVRRRCPGLDRVLWLALLPAIYWLATRVISPPTEPDIALAETGWILVSAVLIAFTVLIALVHRAETELWVETARWALLVPVLASLSAISVLTGLGRLDLDLYPVTAALGFETLGAVAATAALLTVCALLLPTRFRAIWLARLLVLAQIGLALGFLSLLLPPAEINGALLRQGGLEGPSLPIVLVVLSGMTLLGILRTSGAFTTPTLSPWAVAGALLTVKLGAGGAIAYAMDNPLDFYHHGEWLLPWDQLWHHGAIPYVDMSPSHGLINLLGGGFASLFGDGSMLALQQGQILVRGGALAVAALILGRLLGGPAALLLLAVLPFSGRTPILLLVAAFFGWFLTRMDTEKPVAWLIGAAICAVALVGLAPGQGAVASVALIPAIVVMLWQAWKQERSRLAKAAGALMLICLIFGGLAVFGIGPGAVLAAQIRFILENRAIYEAVHGLPWSAAISADMPLGPVAWEVLRNLWMGITAVLLGALLLALVDRRRRGPWIFMGLAVAIYLLGTLSHTLGRIDLGGPSRTGAQTVFALAVLVPMVVALMAPRRLVILVCAVVVPVGLLAPGFGSALDARSLAKLHRFADREDGARIWIDGATEGVVPIGAGLLSPAVIPMIKPSLGLIDKVLRPEETYLDLTNRNSNYFYLRRAVPVESGAVLTLSTEGMQRRSIAKLRADPPPLVLVDAGGDAAQPFPPPLRIPLIYRYLMEQVANGSYQVWSDGPLTALIKSDRLPSPALSTQDGTAKLDAIWGRRDLERLPTAWGRSPSTIRRDLNEVAGTVTRTEAPDGSQTLTATLSAPAKIDFLGLNLDCNAGGEARLNWQADGHTLGFNFSPVTGLNLLPLDTWPSQAAAPATATADFTLSLPDTCVVSSAGISLWAREGA